MAADRSATLEDALAAAEADAEAALKAANAAIRALKKVRAAAHAGDLRELPRSLDAAHQAIGALGEQMEAAREGWDFDEETYLGSGDYTREILRTAKQAGVKVYEEDDRLYCYPHLIRILPGDRAVMIDKTRERRLRPSFLVRHLEALQRRPVRFRPEAFLESLRDAYDVAVRAREGKDAGAGAVVPLVEIYELLTLLPGQSKEYTLPEFARDIYLLDKSGVTTTRKGFRVSWPASSGTRSGKRTITVITQDGREKKYYGIAFVEA